MRELFNKFEPDDIECFMLTRDGNCKGMICQSVCGPDCPFRKTWKEQRAIEKKIVDRFKEANYIGTYRSCIDNSILYKNDGLHSNVYI